ncbi:hypothetical protein [Arthrobacter sp. MMS24-S77]
MNALLSSCLEGQLDPVEGLARLSNAELAFLADALFKHLDDGEPAFGVKSWYDAVLDELAARGEGTALVGRAAVVVSRSLRD